MNPDDSEIELLLGQYRPATAGDALREKVMRRTRTRRTWTCLEAIAATLLIGLNLAQIGGSLAQLSSPPPINDAHTQQIAMAISHLDLAISPDQQRVMAQQLAAGEQLRLLPLVHGKINDQSAGAMQ